MSLNVLVLETYADVYARHLREAFPGIVVHPMTAIAGPGLDLAAILGMRVVGASRTPRQAKGFDAMVETARLVEAVGDADYVINILPGGPQNAGMIGAAVFAAMKSTAFFINVGRGETVDEQALIAVLRDRRIAGAGLDVFNTEPLPAESPLWDLPNAFICPHIGGMFAEYEDCVVPILTGNLRLFLAGRTAELRNVVPH